MQWLHLCVPGTMWEDLLLWFVIAGTAAHTSLGISVCQRCACRQCFLPMNASEVRWRPIVPAVVFCFASCFMLCEQALRRNAVRVPPFLVLHVVVRALAC